MVGFLVGGQDYTIPVVDVLIDKLRDQADAMHSFCLNQDSQDQRIDWIFDGRMEKAGSFRFNPNPQKLSKNDSAQLPSTNVHKWKLVAQRYMCYNRYKALQS